MAEGLVEPQWLNLVQKPTNHIMVKKSCFMTGAHGGIGAEIARAALAVGASLPTQASVASWPSPNGESRCFLQDVELRSPPSIAFTPSGPLVYQWQKDRRSSIRKGLQDSAQAVLVFGP